MNDTCATKPFELIQSDLKSFKTESYHKSRYIIIFYDDYSICPWAGLSPYEPRTRPYLPLKSSLNMSKTSTPPLSKAAYPMQGENTSQKPLGNWCAIKAFIQWATKLYLWVCTTHPTAEWMSWAIYSYLNGQSPGNVSSHLPTWFLLGVCCSACSTCVQSHSQMRFELEDTSWAIV